MRTVFLTFVCFCFLISCNSDDSVQNRNPNLLDVNFSITLSTIQTLDLQFPANAIFVPQGGLRGVFVINTGSGIFAWEAADPNVPLSECSRMTLDGIEALSNCEEGRRYNLITGQSLEEVLPFPLLSYRVNQNGDVITVSN